MKSDFNWNGQELYYIVGTTNNQNPTFQTNESKLYLLVATLSTQKYIKILKQLESGFKRTINWKYI